MHHCQAAQRAVLSFENSWVLCDFQPINFRWCVEFCQSCPSSQKLESNAWVLLLHYRQPVPSRNICVIAAGVVLSNLAFPPTWKCGATLYKLSLTEIILQKYVFTGFPSSEVSLLLALNHHQPLSCSQFSQIPRVSLFDSCPVGRCRLQCSVVIGSLCCSIAMLQ